MGKDTTSTVADSGINKSDQEMSFGLQRTKPTLRATSSKLRSILEVRQKLASEKRSAKFSRHARTGRKSETSLPLKMLSTSQDRRQSDRRPLAIPFDERATEWNEEQEEWARHKVWKLENELLKINGHYRDVKDTKISSEEMFFQSPLRTQDGTNIVDSGASIHMTGISSSPRGG